MKFEVVNKKGEKEILEYNKIPKFSPNFNSMVKNLKIGESMYEITSMTNIKRLE